MWINCTLTTQRSPNSSLSFFAFSHFIHVFAPQFCRIDFALHMLCNFALSHFAFYTSPIFVLLLTKFENLIGFPLEFINFILFLLLILPDQMSDSITLSFIFQESIMALSSISCLLSSDRRSERITVLLII